MSVRDIHSKSKQRHPTTMLVSVNLVFYLFTTLAITIYIAEYYPSNYRDLSRIKRPFLSSQISILFLQLYNARKLFISKASRINNLL